jgi:hypothetical protein
VSIFDESFAVSDKPFCDEAPKIAGGAPLDYCVYHMDDFVDID